VLAFIGALAVVCFVRLTSTIFLGSARSDAAAGAHESPLLIRVPMVVLAAACILLGVFPSTVAHALEMVGGVPGVAAPFLRALSVPLQAALLVTALAVAALVAATRRSPRRATWDCGYARPTTRMQYTAGSLSEWFASRLLPTFLRPVGRVSAPIAMFSTTVTFTVDMDEPFADRILQPLAARCAAWATRFRWLQQGRLSLYLLYIFVTLLATMTWVVVFPHLGALR
jgi:NADH:ubiquinone oxidoreductase subunit 5 (subunit L)/multisubunit Na+/H+ antiporter MnhA subunit